MKNKMLIAALILALIAISIITIIFSKNSNKENKKTEKVEINNLYSEDENISWTEYEGYDIELNESVKITEGGVYTLTGSTDGFVLVDTDDEVKLILKNVSITSKNSPAILIENASLVEVELVGENYLEDGNNYSSSYVDYEGVIYSKDDLVIGGSGSLTIKANLGDGIVSKDNLKITSGTYIIDATDDAIKGKDSVYILNGNFDIKSKGDAIKSTNDQNEELGYIYINDGTFKIESEGDAIDATTNLVINGGNFEINSKDDGMHADIIVEVNGGDISINAIEGIEGTIVRINDGNIIISSSDDGINASKKSDKYTPTVEINGGNITIKMGSGDTDGIDSNGYLYINGGTINITGNSPFDYDINAKYTGGKMIVNGTETDTITNQFANGGLGTQAGGKPDFQGGGEMPPQGERPQRR